MIRAPGERECAGNARTHRVPPHAAFHRSTVRACCRYLPLLFVVSHRTHDTREAPLTRGARRDQPHLPRGVRPYRGDVDPLLRQYRHRRGRRAGGIRGSHRQMAGGRHSTQPGCLDHHDGPKPRYRQVAARPATRRVVARSRCFRGTAAGAGGRGPGAR